MGTHTCHGGIRPMAEMARMVKMSVVVTFFISLCHFMSVSTLPQDGTTAAKETWMGRALWENDIPGQGWDTRSNLIPPSLEFIDFVKIPASDPIEGLGLSFSAFGKNWKLDLSLNTFVVTGASRFDVRNE